MTHSFKQIDTKCIANSYNYLKNGNQHNCEGTKRKLIHKIKNRKEALDKLHLSHSN